MVKAASAKDRDYDVVLSFAGEDRAVAQEIVGALERRGVVVFYDDYEKAALWGEDLYTYLSNIYQNRAHFCVMLISSHYAKKRWTKHERRAAQARAFQDNGVYILPVRLDQTPIEGIPPTVAYLDWAEVDADAIADAVVRKLNKFEDSPAHTSSGAGARLNSVTLNVKSKTALLVFTLAVVCLALGGYYLLQSRGREARSGAAAQLTNSSEAASPVASMAAGDLPAGYKFLSFKEGDPGVPGDNLFVSSLGEESRMVNGGMFFYTFSLKSPIPIKGMRRGVTLALFPPPGVKSLEEFNNLQLGFSNLRPPGQCAFNPGSTATFKTRRVTYNNIQGLAFEIAPAFLQTVGSAGDPNQPQCRMNPDELYLTTLSWGSTKWNQSVSSLDAAAIAYEQGDAPRDRD